LLPLFARPNALPPRKRRKAGALHTLRDEDWRLPMPSMTLFPER
jgi:hypothetical protein